MVSAYAQRSVRVRFRVANEARRVRCSRARQHLIMDRDQRSALPAGLVGDPAYHREFSDLALRLEIHPAHDRISIVASCRCSGPVRLLGVPR